MNHPSKILIVEDGEKIGKMLKTILEEKGYIVDTVKNGKEAMERIKATSYNLALIDIQLPDMEGTKLLPIMRKNNPQMSKIMITGYPTMRTAIESLNKGADGYVLKPIKIESLLNIIKEHI
jgi:DNA-binding NtrC family response regulator